MSMLQPNEVIIEDFNRDGIPDVAVNAYGQGNSVPSGITQYMNVGRVAASIVAVAGTPQSINVTKNGANLAARVLDAAGNRVTYARLTINTPATGPTSTIFGLTGQIKSLIGTTDYAVTPTANNELGPYTVTMTTPLGPGTEATAEFSLTNVPPAPIAAADGPFTTAEDTPLTIAAPGLLANDSDPSGTPITAQVVNPLPAKGVLQLDPNGGFVYTPNPNVNGSDTFRYRAWNGTSGSGTITVTVNISAAADPPVVVNRSFSVNEDVMLSVAATGVLLGATDPDGATTFTAQLLQQAAHGVVTLSANGSFTYMPAPNFNGADSFTFTATDATGQVSLPGTITIDVAPVYDPPVAVGDSYATSEDVALAVAAPGVLANDTFNPGAQVSIAIVPAHGTVTVMSDGSFVYTPNGNYHGTDSFGYDIIEGEGNVRGTVSILVTPANDPPAATDDGYSTIAGAPVSVAANGVIGNDSDVDGDALTVSIATPPDHGSVKLNADGSFFYTPALNFAGGDAFTYTLSDGTASATGTVSIFVAPAMTTTSLSLSAASIALGESVTLTASVAVVAPGSGAPTGVVMFMNGSTLIGTANLVGTTASMSTSSLPPGTLGLNAFYVGDGAFIMSASVPPAMLEVIANTPVGDDVVSTPVDEATGESPITLQFDQVTTPGTTTLEIADAGPAPPSGFKIGNPPIYYNLETNAVFSGEVTVCFHYDEAAVANENRVKLFHFEGGHWTDITISRDTDANVVCGRTSHFSPFAVGEPNTAPEVSAITAIVDAAAPRLAVAASASFTDADLDDVHAAVWEWGDGTSSPASISGGVAIGSHTYAAAGNFSIRLTLTDGGSAVSSTTTVKVGDNTAPSITVTVSPREIWPANNRMVAVTISGRITDDASGVAAASFEVADEYGLVQPSGPITVGANGAYSVTVSLHASRNGNDKDGRLYSITVRAVDQVGNAGQIGASSVVLHDQGKK